MVAERLVIAQGSRAGTLAARKERGNGTTGRQGCLHHGRPRWNQQATAERFAEEGAKVVVADIDVPAGEAAASSARARAANGNGDSHFVHCDVTERSSVEAAITQTIARYGKLDILHNNAPAARLLGADSAPTYALCAGTRA
jgi:hypothetical protein